MRKLILSDSQIPPVGKGLRGEDAPVGYLLRQASVAHRIQIEKILSDLCVTLPQYSILKVLSLYPGISNADLARMCLLTPQTVCVIVRNLERINALLRYPHAIHGRIQRLELTETGKQLTAQCGKRVDAFQQQLVDKLSKNEVNIVKKWLIDVAMY